MRNLTMRRIISLILLISCVVLLAGCIETPTTPQIGYDVDREYVFGDTLKFKIENDIENEQFIVIYKILRELIENATLILVFTILIQQGAYLILLILNILIIQAVK
jgi:hypothetical protein